MQAVLAGIVQNLPQRAAAALYQEAEAIMAIAKTRTPVDTGALRASGYTAPPDVSGDTISVELGFGGAASEYAVFVHERFDLKHAPGTGPKFLEDPLKEAAPGLADRLAKRIELG